MNILFICSKNEWRSRTAETIFKQNENHQVRSAGTSQEARVKVNEKLIHWADLIFVMEKKHKQRLEEKFGDLLHHKNMVVLNIEDNYRYMDEELMQILTVSVNPYLDMNEE